MKKGFTLIELLAVILVLGIIALIAIPVVNNIINDAKEGEEKPSESATQQNLPFADGSKYKAVSDNNSNGLLDIGDEIQVNGENFYVISNTNGTISALAKYNLLVGNEVDGSTWAVTPLATTTGKQDPTARGYVEGEAKHIGTVAFSDNYGWPYANNADINIQSYDGPVKTAINNYKTVVTNASKVRLITKTELEGLGCDSSSYTCRGASAWVYSTTYWSGSADSLDANYVWFVNSNGNFDSHYFDHVYFYGVRPVIEIAA